MDLILTGREVSASEAEHIGELTGGVKFKVGASEWLVCSFQTGLANRVVPNGQSLQAAIELSKKIAAFPQQCMRVDRLSAMHSTYSKNGHLEALRFEFEQGSKVVKQESVAGARRFVGGIGRGSQLEWTR